MSEKTLVERFQCPGCILGSDTKCGEYKFDQNQKRCVSHVLGTSVGLGNFFALGLPKGFCKPGFDGEKIKNKIDVRLWDGDGHPEWNHLNVPVWAMEQDGFLFVRTFAPRINMSWVDVVDGGTLSLVPNAINVAEFLDNID